MNENPEELDRYLGVSYNANSKFIKHLLKDNNLDSFKLIVSNTFQEKNKAIEGTNNVDTKKVDAIARDIFEALGLRKISAEVV